MRFDVTFEKTVCLTHGFGGTSVVLTKIINYLQTLDVNIILFDVLGMGY